MSKHTAYQPPTKSNKGNADSETETITFQKTKIQICISHRLIALRRFVIIPSYFCLKELIVLCCGKIFL